MSRRILSLAVLALIAILTLAACGGEEATDAPGAYTVPPDDAVALIEGGEYAVIDVRSPDEFEQAHIVGAVNIDVDGSDFSERIAELDVDHPYLVYCRSGNRSARAADEMEAIGMAEIADAGGLADLARAGAPVE